MPVDRTRRMEPFVVTIDDSPVRLHLKRMTVEESDLFRLEFAAYGDGRLAPPPIPPEENSAAARLQFLEEERVVAAATADWLRDVFGKFVRVEEGDFRVDGESIVDGAQFCEENADDRDVIGMILLELFERNVLTPAQKKTLRSLHAFATGSASAPSTGAPGKTPAAAAASVASEASAAAAAVTAPSSDALSGTTAPTSSSVSVPSAS